MTWFSLPGTQVFLKSHSNEKCDFFSLLYYQKTFGSQRMRTGKSLETLTCKQNTIKYSFSEKSEIVLGSRVSQVALMVKYLPANTGDLRETVSIAGSGRSSGGGQGNPLQYPCLENTMDRGAFRVTVHRVAKSRTRLK